MTSQTRTGGRLSRRDTLRGGAAVLVAGAVGGTVAGCTLNNPLTTEHTPAAEAVRDLAPDVAVAVDAVTLVRGAVTAVEATGRRHPELAARLAGLLAAHRAHLAAVVDAVPDGVDTSAAGAGYVVPGRSPRALTQLAASEQTWRDGLVGLAIRAESGPFARLLGSMAAALSQQLKVLAP